jgi:hypothetical protein
VPRVLTAKTYKAAGLGDFLLSISGQAQDWYVGGMGTYLAKPVDDYSHIQIDIFGNGENSGRLKVELFDDDNGSKEVEQDASYIPLKDDRFSYTVDISWEGWRQVVIPFAEFKDINPDVGNNVWDPDAENGSGGLLHVQFIVLANSKSGKASYKLDNVKFVKLKEQLQEQ